MSCSDHKNPLTRGGTSQDLRLLPALKTEYVSLDENQYKDWIVFAGKYMERIKFYDEQNLHQGYWESFFTQDISAICGSIAIQNIQQYRHSIKVVFDKIKTPETSITESKILLGSLFACLFQLSNQVDFYYRIVESNAELKSQIKGLIRNQFEPTFKKILSHYKAAKQKGLVTEKAFPEWKVLNATVQKPKDTLEATWSNLWYKPFESFQEMLAETPSDASIFGEEVWSKKERIAHAANHNLFTQLFDQYLAFYTKLIDQAEQMLLSTLSDWPQHEAHYTLFLSFLKLFKVAQSDLNELTNRHLNFYYNDVLHLSPKPAQPNKAHVLFTLTKNTSEYLLLQDTSFFAGKDAAGKEILYGANKDVLLNKGTVAELKSLYRTGGTESLPGQNNSGRIFAAPVINSKDGAGEELDKADPTWHPFFHKSFEEGQLTSIDLPPARIGFALASHYLFLSEGTRKIELLLIPESGSHVLPNDIKAQAFLTTEKGWFKTAITSVTKGKTTTGSIVDAYIVTLSLTGNDPQVAAYNAEVHEGHFNTDTPVVKVELVHDASKYGYDAIKNFRLKKIGVRVTVGDMDGFALDGLKNLQLSSDTNVLNPSKSFSPFGNPPIADARFIIGHPEIFSKKNAKLSLSMKWKGLPADSNNWKFTTVSDTDFDVPQANLEILSNGKWASFAGGSSDLFSDGSETINIDLTGHAIPDDTIQDYNIAEPYSQASNKGWMRLRLDGDFNHKGYQSALISALTNNTEVPVEPYSPVVSSINMSYQAELVQSLDEAKSAVLFYHLHPFGEALQNENVYLLPRFEHEESTTVVQNQAEWYIGIEGIKPGDSIQILFQMIEGSTNPLTQKPKDHVIWRYLKGHVWMNLADNQIDDDTLQLTQSGIIGFVIPSDATTDHTILSAGKIWLSASVEKAADAVTKMILVQAQAALLTQSTAIDSTRTTEATLPANAITKARPTIAEIKKVEQPFASFGGRGAENTEDYHTRVSERLRHKDRAISIWDYERLILEAFPTVYKVKCLNHTRYDDVYDEEAPGHVTIITIPSLQQRNEENPLRPYTNQNTLIDIAHFLEERTSCHVQTHVRHPQFEEVRLEFSLHLHEGYAFNYYSELLKQEITRFLTPWAFDNTVDIAFGGKVEKSVLINFIEERYYVDFITDVKMFHKKDPQNGSESDDVSEVVASENRSILVSAPASKHVIHEIEEEEVDPQKVECIDELNIVKVKVPPNPKPKPKPLHNRKQTKQEQKTKRKYFKSPFDTGKRKKP